MSEGQRPESNQRKRAANEKNSKKAQLSLAGVVRGTTSLGHGKFESRTSKRLSPYHNNLVKTQNPKKKKEKKKKKRHPTTRRFERPHQTLRVKKEYPRRV